MSTAIIADIHANAVALDAVVADIERNSVEQVVCLGDVAGTGPEPVRALERFEELACPVVMGNVDETLLDPPGGDSPENLDELFDGIGGEVDLLAGGHTHLPFIRRYRGMVLLNPGSVGLPHVWDRTSGGYRNPPWAEYALVTGTPDSLQVELRRCPVDVTAISAAVAESDMPHAAWWLEGWQSSQ